MGNAAKRSASEQHNYDLYWECLEPTGWNETKVGKDDNVDELFQWILPRRCDVTVTLPVREMQSRKIRNRDADFSRLLEHLAREALHNRIRGFASREQIGAYQFFASHHRRSEKGILRLDTLPFDPGRVDLAYSLIFARASSALIWSWLAYLRPVSICILIVAIDLSNFRPCHG